MIEAWEILELEGSGVIEIPVYPIRTLVVFVGAVGFIVCILSVFQSITRVREYQSMNPKRRAQNNLLEITGNQVWN